MTLHISFYLPAEFHWQPYLIFGVRECNKDYKGHIKFTYFFHIKVMLGNMLSILGRIELSELHFDYFW